MLVEVLLVVSSCYFICGAGKIIRPLPQVTISRKLTNISYSHFLSLGAIVTLLSLAMEPMLQAIITTHGELDEVILQDGMVAIGMTNRYDGGVEDVQDTGKSCSCVQNLDGEDLVPRLAPQHSNMEAEITEPIDGNTYMGTYTLPSSIIETTIYSSLQATSNTTISDVAYTCPTGNCTSPIFVSLGFCNTCINISDLLVKQSFLIGGLIIFPMS